MSSDEIAQAIVAALRALEFDGDLVRYSERTRAVLLLFDPAHDDDERVMH
jgi:hypothetical protein